MAESQGENSQLINVTIKTPKENKVVQVDAGATVDQVIFFILIL